MHGILALTLSEMELSELVQQVEGFNALPPREKIRLFAWYLHTKKGKLSFDNASIRGCYDELHLAQPNVTKYLSRLADSKPPDLIKIKGGYPNDWFVACVVRWFGQRFGKAPICHKQ